MALKPEGVDSVNRGIRSGLQSISSAMGQPNSNFSVFSPMRPAAPKNKFASAAEKLNALNNPASLETRPIDTSSLANAPLPGYSTENQGAIQNTPEISNEPTSSGFSIPDAIAKPKNKQARKDLIDNFEKSGEAPGVLDADMRKQVDQLLQGRQPKQTSPLAEGFAQALLGFLPTIAGAIFGGSEGGAAGADVGLAALKQYEEAKTTAEKSALTREELNMKRQQLGMEAQKIAQTAQLAEAKEKGDYDRLRLTLGADLSKARIANEGTLIKTSAELEQASKKEFIDKLNNYTASNASVDAEKSKMAFAAVDRIYKQWQADPKSVGGLAGHTMIQQYLKVLEPTSAVLGGELKSAKDAAQAFKAFQGEHGIPAGFEGIWTEIKGGGDLTKETIHRIYTLTQLAVKDKVDMTAAKVTDIINHGKNIGLDQGYVLSHIGTKELERQAALEEAVNAPGYTSKNRERLNFLLNYQKTKMGKQ